MQRQFVQDWLDSAALQQAPDRDDGRHGQRNKRRREDAVEKARKRPAYSTPESALLTESALLPESAPSSQPNPLPESALLPEATLLPESTLPPEANMNALYPGPGSVQSLSSPPTSPPASSKRPSTATTSSAAKRLHKFPTTVQVMIYDENVMESDAPLQFKELIDGVLDFSSGVKTVPASLREQLGSSERIFRRDDLFYTPEDARAKSGESPSLSEVDRIVYKVRKLMCSVESEAAWNCFAQAPLMALAEDHSRHYKSVSYMNIVHATISPRSLIPETGDDLCGKLVDFAMVLSTNKKLKNAMENLPPPCNRGGTKSLNHTQNETLLDSPIVISIETKPEQGDLIGAHVQLAVWAAAHLNRLEELIRLSKTDAKLPWLPLLLVHGPKWFLLFARRNTDDKTDVVAKIEFGDASSRSGVFAIISVLQLLMDWAEQQYRPWFEAIVCRTEQLPKPE